MVYIICYCKAPALSYHKNLKSAKCLEATVCRCSTKQRFLKFSKTRTDRNFVKKETPAQLFSRECWKILRNTFFQNTSGRLLNILNTI